MPRFEDQLAAGTGAFPTIEAEHIIMDGVDMFHTENSGSSIMLSHPDRVLNIDGSSIKLTNITDEVVGPHGSLYRDLNGFIKIVD